MWECGEGAGAACSTLGRLRMMHGKVRTENYRNKNVGWLGGGSNVRWAVGGMVAETERLGAGQRAGVSRRGEQRKGKPS